MGEEVRGLRSTNRQSQNSRGGVKYSVVHGAAQEPVLRTDSWTRTMVGALPEGVGVAG